MSRMFFKGFNIVVLFFALSECSVAGGVDRFFFDTLGKRLNPIEKITDPATALFLEGKVKSTCPAGTSGICISWSLVLDNSAHEAVYRTAIQNAASIWNSNSDLQIHMQYTGLLSSNPSSTGIDEFGNSIFSGNFLVSFAPPAELAFGAEQVSTTQHYVKPDLAAKTSEILWAGIYFNPQLIPGTNYDLKTALLHEMGRAIGLAPSGIPSSVMFPVSASSSRTNLTQDDILWAGSQYGGTAFSAKSGKLSGQVLNGKDGRPWIGAHIQALPSESVQAFTQGLNRSLITSGTFSREDGKFEFRELTPGTYLLLMEPDTEAPAAISSLDHWLQQFSTMDSFNLEFYDGAGRESNQEAIYSSSPQAVLYAATLLVEAGKENSGVTLITNVADPKIEKITAQGATSEVLSKITPPAEKAATDGGANPDQSSSSGSSGGGCGLVVTETVGFSASLLWLAFALCLLVLIRRDRRVKWCRSESPKRGRYVR